MQHFGNCFYGIYRVRKANLMAAFVIEIAKYRCCAYFINFEELVLQLKKATSENRLEAGIKWFCRNKLLIIDEHSYQKMDVDLAN